MHPAMILFLSSLNWNSIVKMTLPVMMMKAVVDLHSVFHMPSAVKTENDQSLAFLRKMWAQSILVG